MTSEKPEHDATPSPPSSDVKKGEHGGAKSSAHWKHNEEHVLPKNRMSLVFTGLMACVFLAALDQVCTPPIRPPTPRSLLAVLGMLARSQGLTSYHRQSSPLLFQPSSQNSAVARTTVGLAGTLPDSVYYFIHCLICIYHPARTSSRRLPCPPCTANYLISSVRRRAFLSRHLWTSTYLEPRTEADSLRFDCGFPGEYNWSKYFHKLMLVVI